MKTELIETGDLSSQLTIVLEKDDYIGRLNDELKKYKNKAHIKGFRKGKTPMSAIRKMYGQSVLAEVINDKLQNGLSDYINDNKIEILGNPLPSDNQKQIDFDIKNLSDFEFVFDLGLAPEFILVGASEADVYDDIQVDFEGSMIDEELESLRKRFGTQEEVDETILSDDILQIEITEQSAPADRDAFQTNITVMPDRLNEDAQKLVLGKKLGEEFKMDILNFEKDADEEYVKKYFLKDAPEDITFEFNAIIAGIKRLKLAELNEDLFTKAFGNPEIKTEEEARNYLKEELESFYKTQGRSITKRYILENLTEVNNFELPDEFLKRWLLSTNEKTTPEDIERDYSGFVKNLKWTLIKQSIAKAHDLEIGPDEIKAALRIKIEKQFAQFGGYPGINYDDMVNRLMQNQETIQKEYEELLAEKVLDKVCDIVELKPKNVSLDKYKEIVKELQENIA